MLTDKQRENLKEAIAQTDNKRLKTRMSIFLLIDKGMKPQYVANKLDIDRRTVDYWLQKGDPDDLKSFETIGQKTYHRPLTKTQKLRLQKAKSDATDYKLKTRYSIFIEANKGLSFSEIAIELGITKDIVKYWLQKADPDDLSSFKNENDQGNGWKIKITPEIKEQLISIASKSQPNKGNKSKRWRCRELAEELTRRTGIKITRFNVHYTLKKEGISLDREQGV